MELVRAGYELWNAGDVAGLAALFSDDIEYRNSPEWPGQQVYHGAQRVVHFLREEVAEVIALDQVEIERIDVYGDEILLALLAHVHGREAGVDIGKVRVFHLAKVRDHKVVRVRVFLDERQALEAVEAPANARAGGGPDPG